MISLQQAGVNALAAWLSSQIPGVQIASRWPSPDRALPPKAITILMAGKAFDTPIERNLLKQVDGVSPLTTGTWQIRSRRQPIQLDVWAQTDPDRDDIIAQLDIALNAAEFPVGGVLADPAGSGILLNVGDGWSNTFADFSFDGPELDDTPDSVKRSEYRAIYSGDMYMMLTVDKTTAKIIQIQLTESSGLFNTTLP